MSKKNKREGKGAWYVIRHILIVLLTACAGAIIALCVLYYTGMIEFTFLKKSTIPDETTSAVASSESGENNNSNKASSSAISATTKPVRRKRNHDRFMFVGDSRYVGMQIFAQDDDIFVSKSEQGYAYLVEQQYYIQSLCTKNTAIIIGLGVNDVRYNVEKYVTKVNEMAQNLDCDIYYMSVNPVDEAVEATKGYNITNEEIDTFNHTLEIELDPSITYVDSNSYLKKHGYHTLDGLHYDNDTYQLIYGYIKAAMKG